MVKRLIEQVAFEARSNEYVDKKSGVSARLTIAAFENAVSSAERRAIIHNEKKTQVWISDLNGHYPRHYRQDRTGVRRRTGRSLPGGGQLAGQSHPYTVYHYFPNPDALKKQRTPAKLRSRGVPKKRIRIKTLPAGLMPAITLIS